MRELTVADIHTYYVIAGTKPVLVHNNDCPDLFDEFGVTPGEGLDLDSVSGDGGRSYITYVAKDKSGAVRYVGRAQGLGNPQQVLNGRLSRGHDIAKSNPSFTFHVVDVQKTMDASRGAEEFFLEGYRQRGAKLLNSLESPPLGFSRAERGRSPFVTWMRSSKNSLGGSRGFR